MSEMVTRVAKAMAESAGFCWENCAQSQWEQDARAGIEAMHEPTDQMIGAGDELCPVARGTESHAMSGGVVPEDYWRVMIVAALAPDPADVVGTAPPQNNFQQSRE